MRGQKSLIAFEIPIMGMKEGIHHYHFQVDEDFWAYFDHPDFKRGDFKVHLELERTERLMHLYFDIEGSIELTCDRTLRVFWEPLHLQERLMYRFGATAEELSESLWQIPHEQEAISVAQHIYDFIGLALPMKKLHPDVRLTEAEADEADAFLVYSSHATEQTSTEEEEEEPAPPQDPRWAALARLQAKNNNNKN